MNADLRKMRKVERSEDAAAAHEQIRAQLSQLPGIVMTDAEDGEKPRTVH